MYDNNARMDADTIAGSGNIANPVLEKPKPVDVSDFNQALSGDSPRNAKVNEGAPVATQAQDVGKPAEKLSEAQIKELLTMLLELIAMLSGTEEGKNKGKGEGKSPSGSPSGSGGGAPSGGAHNAKNTSPGKIENNKVVGENVAKGDGQIPKPTEHVQHFSLGNKQVTIGGDGSASAAEVQQTKQTMTDLYQNSPSFKSMIDSSPNSTFEVSVGKRSDNTSWGNADGRVFMNLNDIKPGSSDNFQALTAHEFAHAAIDLGHGSEMQRFEKIVSQEA